MEYRCIAFLASCVLAPAAVAQRASAGDWPMYADNLAGTKYSGLKQINTKNVSQLAQAWSYRLAERARLKLRPLW